MDRFSGASNFGAMGPDYFSSMNSARVSVVPTL